MRKVLGFLLIVFMLAIASCQTGSDNKDQQEKDIVLKVIRIGEETLKDNNPCK